MENEVLNAFLGTFLSIVLPVLAAFLAGLAVQGIRWLNAKIKSEKPKEYEILAFLANAAVKAAEQAKVGELIENKKEFAIAYVEKWMGSYGFTFDLDSIAEEIERAVYDEINKNK